MGTCLSFQMFLRLDRLGPLPWSPQVGQKLQKGLVPVGLCHLVDPREPTAVGSCSHMCVCAFSLSTPAQAGHDPPCSQLSPQGGTRNIQ